MADVEDEDVITPYNTEYNNVPFHEVEMEAALGPGRTTLKS